MRKTKRLRKISKFTNKNKLGGGHGRRYSISIKNT